MEISKTPIVWSNSPREFKHPYNNLPPHAVDYLIKNLPLYTNLQPYVDKWKAISLSTEPADRPKAEAGILGVYKYLKQDKPKIVWCDSPANFRPVYDMYLASKIRGFEEYEKTEHLAIAAIVRRNLSMAKFNQEFSRTNFIRWAIKSACNVNFELCHDDEEITLFDVLIDRIPNEFRKCRIEIAEAANWWQPLYSRCYVSERPNILKTDPEGNRLHCENGPAVAYGKELIIWAINGVIVNEQIVLHPDTQDIKDIRFEENAEVKRVRIERYGWDEYLCKTDAKIVDKRRNDVECTKEALVKTEDMTLLLCHCPSTGRVYTMEVPTTVDTCEQAQNFLWSGSRQNTRQNKFNLVGRS